MVAFAIFGSSRHLVDAADSATAVIVATVLASGACRFSTRYVALTGLVALVAAGMLILARLLSRFVGEYHKWFARLGLIECFVRRCSARTLCLLLHCHPGSNQRAATSRASALGYRERFGENLDTLWAWLSQTRRALRSQRICYRRRSAIHRSQARSPAGTLARLWVKYACNDLKATQLK
jgi:hypothetical protein